MNQGMNATIDVERLDAMDFMVTVNASDGPSQHTVIATLEDHMNLAPTAPIEALVAETFRFLLDHETHDAIEPHFTLQDVKRLFMDYEFEMKSRFGG